jgi:hypothetical protein
LIYIFGGEPEGLAEATMRPVEKTVPEAVVRITEVDEPFDSAGR